MSGRNVLITGCSSGIGLDAALKLKEKGFAVIPTARKLADVERLREKGFASAFLLDLQQPESVLAAREIIESTENLYALVNNAWSGPARRRICHRRPCAISSSTCLARSS